MSTVDQMLVERKAMDFVEAFATELCADFVETKNSTVCAPAVKMMGDIVIPSLTQFFLSPDYACSNKMLNYCDSPSFVELPAEDYVEEQLSKKTLASDDFIDTRYDLIKTYGGKERPTVKAIHMSDNHLDFLYTPGTDAACTLPVCCNPVNGFTSDPERAAGFWGDTRCDLPPRVMNSMFEYIKEEVKPDMFIWTGDNSAHRVWENTQSEIESYVVNITAEWKKVFDGTGVAMLPTQGNHDTWPVNVENFAKSDDDHPLIEFDKIWADFFTTEEAKETFRKWGYYSMPLVLNGKTVKGTKVIGINSQTANNMNWHLLHQLNDPANQIEWLEAELTQLEKEGGKAIIISHIPPIEYPHSFGARYRALMDRFQAQIAFQMHGHTHVEEFHVTRAIKSGHAIGWDFVAGSVTTYKGKNPAFTVIEFDEEFMVPVTINTYYFDIARSNKENRPIWGHLHDWNDEYGLDDLRPSNILDFAQRMKDDEALADQFLLNKSRGIPSGKDCDAKCRKSLSCGLSTNEKYEAAECKTGKPAVPDFYEMILDPWLKRVD